MKINKKTIMKMIKELQEEANTSDSKGLVEDMSQKTDVISYLQDNPDASNQEVADALGIKKNNVSGLRSRLRKEGLIGEGGKTTKTKSKEPDSKSISKAKDDIIKIIKDAGKSLSKEDLADIMKELSDVSGVKITEDTPVSPSVRKKIQTGTKRTKGKGVLPEHKAAANVIREFIRDAKQFKPSLFNISKTFEKNVPLLGEAGKFGGKHNITNLIYDPKDKSTIQNPLVISFSTDSRGENTATLSDKYDNVEDIIDDNRHRLAELHHGESPMEYIVGRSRYGDAIKEIGERINPTKSALRAKKTAEKKAKLEAEKLAKKQAREDKKNADKPFTYTHYVSDYEHSGDTDRDYQEILNILRREGILRDVSVTTEDDYDYDEGNYGHVIIRGRGDALKRKVNEALRDFE